MYRTWTVAASGEKTRENKKKKKKRNEKNKTQHLINANAPFVPYVIFDYV